MNNLTLAKTHSRVFSEYSGNCVQCTCCVIAGSNIIRPAGLTPTRSRTLREEALEAALCVGAGVKGHAFNFLPSLPPLLSLLRTAPPRRPSNRGWPTPKPTRLASSVPTCPATSSRTAWSTSCLSSPPASACSPSAASRAPTTSTPAASTATGQQRTPSFFFFFFILFFLLPRAERR